MTNSTDGPAGSTPPHPPLLAGQAPLDEVMARLARDRPVFHSEADLQHSFALALRELAPELRCRLEVPQQTGGKRPAYLDLLCTGPSARTVVEFKYVTRRWTGTCGPDGETYALRNHAATDLARLGFVTDLTRTERFGEASGTTGLALMVTNEPRLWTPPAPGGAPRRDQEFRLHQGRTLAGTLRWAGGSYLPNTRVLRGRYPLDWRPYSRQPGAGGEFRYLAVATGGAA
ncbi:hypothetical protein [Kitasatospora sp. NPDC094015]|uniref:hypothetical protein n=1 Tax=Kitasatospora sp. NPDC094015 TaxID=3155205 RepID=UPI0033177D92